MKQIIKDCLNELTGGKPIGSYYMAGFVFALIAILLSMYVKSRKRDPNSPRTPEKFSWYFLIWDNTKTMFAGLAVQFIMFRAFDLSNIFAMLGVGFGIGFGLDQLLGLIMEKSNVLKFLNMDRDKIPTKPQ